MSRAGPWYAARGLQVVPVTSCVIFMRCSVINTDVVAVHAASHRAICTVFISVRLQGSPHARSLQQQVENTPPADITSVTTPEQLRESIRRGDRDIVIQAHLDLTDLPLASYTACAKNCSNPLGLVEARSIRVCATLSSRWLFIRPSSVSGLCFVRAPGSTCPGGRAVPPALPGREPDTSAQRCWLHACFGVCPPGSLL